MMINIFINQIWIILLKLVLRIKFQNLSKMMCNKIVKAIFNTLIAFKKARKIMCKTLIN